MSDDKPMKIAKELFLDRANVLKEFCSRDGKNLVVWQIVKINELKVTFVAFKSPLFNHLEKDNKVSIQNYEQIGESMTLKVDKDIIDVIINHYGDIIAHIFHQDGVVKTILTFEEADADGITLENLRNFLNRKVAGE